MKTTNSPLANNNKFKLRIVFITLALLLLIFGSITQSKYNPAKWMTYRDFDVPGQKNFINYLNPGVKDVSSKQKYQFTDKHITLLLIVLFFFFPLMFFLRIVRDIDFKLHLYRYLTQWLTFVVARLGIFRITGVCPIKRSGLGVFPFINCQSCELATGACALGTFQMSMLNHTLPLALIGKLILVGILSGRLICGWICPYGFLSDIFDKIPGKRINISLKFSYIKYVFLIVFVISSLSYLFRNNVKHLFYCSYICAAGFYYGVLEYALTTGLKAVISEFPLIHYMLVCHFVMGILIIVGSIKLGGRFFCKYICPLGTFYGLFNKTALFRLKLNNNKCTGCKRCISVCPMKISILNKSHLSRSSCILCGRCEKICPTKKIEYSFGLSKQKTLINKPSPVRG